MLLFPIAVGAGFVLGFAGGGRLRAISRLRARALLLFGLALGIIVWSHHLSPEAGRWAGLTGSLVLFTWMGVNALRGQRSMRAAFAFLALGWLLNLVVVAANDGMPVSRTAMRVTNTQLAQDGVYPNRHQVADGHTTFSLLGDIIPLPPVHAVVSIGDLMIYAGFAMVISGAMKLPAARLGALGRLHFEPSMQADGDLRA